MKRHYIEFNDTELRVIIESLLFSCCGDATLNDTKRDKKLRLKMAQSMNREFGEVLPQLRTSLFKTDAGYDDDICEIAEQSFPNMEVES